MKTFREYLEEEHRTLGWHSYEMDSTMMEELSEALMEDLTNQDKEEVETFIAPFLNKNLRRGKKFLVVATFVDLRRTPILSVTPEPLKFVGISGSQYKFEKDGETRLFPKMQELGRYVRYYFLMNTVTEFEHFHSLVTLKWSKPVVKRLDFEHGL